MLHAKFSPAKNVAMPKEQTNRHKDLALYMR